MIEFGYLSQGDISCYANCSNAHQKVKLVRDFLGGKIVSSSEIDSVATLCLAVSNEQGFLRAIYYSVLKRKQVVLFCWDPPGITLWDSHSVGLRIRQWCMRFLMSVAVLLSRGMILNLHPGFVERYLPRMIWRKIYAFPNGTTPRYNDEKVGGATKVFKRIVIACRVSAHKGCWQAADFFVKLHKRDPEISLVWIGGGEDKKIGEYILSQGVAEEKLVMTGDLPREKALPFVATGELALNTYENKPSLKWNYILKAPEFLHYGIPIVTRPLPGTCEYAIDGETALVYEKDEEVISRLIALLNDRKRLAEMSRNARRRSELYDWDLINKKIAAQIRKMI